MTRIAVVLFMLVSMNIFPQKLNISGLNLSEVSSMIEKEKTVDLGVYYIWTGSINSINKTDSITEVTVIKSEWKDKNTLITYKAILKTSDPVMIEKILSAGINKKIVFIVQITSIKNNIPVCIPLLIKGI